MKKNALILLAQLLLCTALWAQSGGRLLTIEARQIRLGQLLDEISRQAGVHFSYDARLIDPEQQIAFSVRQATLEDCLTSLCGKLGLEYRLIDQLVVFTPARRRQQFSLTGYLYDQASGESLIGAVVGIKGTALGTFTNEFGYYALSLEPGIYTLVYAHVGYKKMETKLVLEKETRKNMRLPALSYELPEVVIKPSIADMLSKRQLGAMQLTPASLNALPEFAGESGLVKGLQSLPGIKTQGDGTAYFFSRGGERDQNLILIDDAPVYNPSHLFGFYSLFIPDFAKSVTVYKSDMPASVGDRLSSIVSIRTRDGNLNKWQFSGSLNPFINRLTVEIPLAKERSSLMASYRRTNFEWLYRKQAPGLDIRFSDLHLKWNHKLNENNRLFFTTIWSADFFQNVDQDAGSHVGIVWANLAATLRWNHVFGPRLFSNTTLYSGNYGSRLFLTPNYWKSELGMLGLKTDFTHYASNHFQSKFGLDLQGYFNNPGSVALDSTLGILPEITPNHVRKTVLYYQGSWKVNKKLKLNAGLRFVNWANLGPATYYTYDDSFGVSDTVQVQSGVYNRYVNADPRISLQVQPDASSMLKLSFGRYHQYLQLISNSVSPFTSLEIWLPANVNIRPQAGQQWALSYVKYFEQANMEVSAALYHKQLRNQIAYAAHATTFLNPLVEGELRFGRMRTYGLELLLKKDFGKLNAQLAYTFSRSFKTIPALNGGREFPALQDIPHDFSLQLNYQLARRIFCSAYWTSFSGPTFTSPTGFFTFNGQQVPIYGARNNDRLPPYHRLDLSMRFVFHKKEDSRFQNSLIFSLYNALGHKNVYAVKFNKTETADGSLLVQTNFWTEQPHVATRLMLGRFVPSLSYKFKF